MYALLLIFQVGAKIRAGRDDFENRLHRRLGFFGVLPAFQENSFDCMACQLSMVLARRGGDDDDAYFPHNGDRSMSVVSVELSDCSSH